MPITVACTVSVFQHVPSRGNVTLFEVPYTGGAAPALPRVGELIAHGSAELTVQAVEHRYVANGSVVTHTVRVLVA